MFTAQGMAFLAKDGKKNQTKPTHLVQPEEAQKKSSSSNDKRKLYRGCRTRKHIKQGSKTSEKKGSNKVYVKQEP